MKRGEHAQTPRHASSVHPVASGLLFTPCRRGLSTPSFHSGTVFVSY